MIGQTISHYRITEKLGEGGMGVVYKAEDTKLRRVVALKFLRSELIENPEHRERFLREAQAAAALDHPNICTVHEIDEVNGETFIAMAYLEGQTVKDKIGERPLKLDEALDIAAQTAQGLQAAHGKGIVHRDIKSANLMVTPQGQVKIMDFGLAQLAERSKLTETATLLGTPSYMSPEQAVGEQADRRTDLWSLGVVLYEMVAGRLPFEGERQEAVLYGISNEEPEPVTALRARLPMELERIIGKALTSPRTETNAINTPRIFSSTYTACRRSSHPASPPFSRRRLGLRRQQPSRHRRDKAPQVPWLGTGLSRTWKKQAMRSSTSRKTPSYIALSRSGCCRNLQRKISSACSGASKRRYLGSRH